LIDVIILGVFGIFSAAKKLLFPRKNKGFSGWLGLHSGFE
jgi:hypothetical protein